MLGIGPKGTTLIAWKRRVHELKVYFKPIVYFFISLAIEPLVHETGHVIASLLTGGQVVSFSILSVHVFGGNLDIIKISGSFAVLIASTIILKSKDPVAIFIILPWSFEGYIYILMSVIEKGGDWYMVPQDLSILFAVIATIVQAMLVTKLFRTNKHSRDPIATSNALSAFRFTPQT